MLMCIEQLNSGYVNLNLIKRSNFRRHFFFYLKKRDLDGRVVREVLTFIMHQ